MPFANADNDARWLVMNAPRPLVGDSVNENGPFLEGRFWALIDLTDSGAALAIETNRKLAAKAVFYATKATQDGMALQAMRPEYAERYMEMPDDERGDILKPFVRKLNEGKTYGELKALAAKGMPTAPEAQTEPQPDPAQVKAAREQAIKDALLALGWEDLGYGSIARTIRGGFKGGMVNPEGLRRLFPRFSEPVLQAVLGEDKVLVSVMMGDNETPEAIAKKFDDAVTAIDKDAVPDMTKEEKVARANELGAAAFAAGKKRVPASDAAITPLLGGGAANDVLKAWLAGWDNANLAAPAFDAQEIADQWRIMPDARRIGLLTAAGIPATSIEILKNKPFEDMPRERQSALAAALLAETPAAAPEEPAAPTVPDGVRRAVEGALETLRGIKSGIDDAAALEQKIGGNGRYQADALRNRQTDIERAQETLAEFRKHAPDNGIDPEAFIASLGGEPDLTPSEAAAEWLKPKEPAAPASAPEPAPAPEPQAPAANPDIDYMQSIIDGGADLADPAIPARLKQIHADNADNADVQALFKEAVKAYSAYAIAKAKAKLA
jgi:hypothetical protein